MDTIGGLLGGCAKQYGDRRALVFNDKEFSFRDLDILSNKLGNSLRRLGIGKGDRVSLYSQNSWEWSVAYYATAKIGGVINPVNVMLTPEELLYVVNDCGAKALITSPEKAGGVLKILDRAETLKHVLVYGDDAPSPALAFNQVLAKGEEELSIVAVGPEEMSTIGYTSGTTGHPKGAMLTHRGVTLNSRLTATMHLKSDKDVVISALPTAHVYGNVVMNGTLITGGTLVLIERFKEDLVFEAIEKYQATMIEGVPAMYMMMMNHPGLESCNMASLKRCTVGGQTMAINAMEEVVERFGCPLLELWGMTEISGLGTTHPYLGESRLGSIGVPLPYCSARIVDVEDPQKVCAPDQPGELMIRGPILMLGYYGKEEATKETIEPDGWLHTGDVGIMDKEGFLYIVDRMKDMILTGGYNIYPAEIERVLLELPGIAMAAVGAIPDKVKGELAKAYVVPSTEAKLDEEEVLKFCREHLAAYKVPRFVKFVDHLPQTSTGKIMRRKLHELD